MTEVLKKAPVSKVIWTESGTTAWTIVAQGDMVVTENGSGPRVAMVKEANYGKYTRVCLWPFLGYGHWVGKYGIKQVVEPTIWSRLVRLIIK